MTISELIAKLTSVQAEHGDLIVALSSDDEGNSFHKVGDFSCGSVNSYGDYTDAADLDGDVDDDNDVAAVTHVVLWP